MAEKADDMKHTGIDRRRREIVRLDVGRVECDVGRVKISAVSVAPSWVDKPVRYPLTSRANHGRQSSLSACYSVFGSAGQPFCGWPGMPYCLTGSRPQRANDDPRRPPSLKRICTRIANDSGEGREWMSD